MAPLIALSEQHALHPGVRCCCRAHTCTRLPARFSGLPRACHLLRKHALLPFAAPAGLAAFTRCAFAFAAHCAALEASHGLQLLPTVLRELWPAQEQVCAHCLHSHCCVSVYRELLQPCISQPPHVPALTLHCNGSPSPRSHERLPVPIPNPSALPRCWRAGCASWARRCGGP